ncbi:transcriptional regulator [Staphylococcus chromogenes]|nr:transcriptional regulator [Staphylococcus chromogenes]
MMIKIKLDEVLKDKNVSLTELSEAVDITIANLSILKTGKAKVIRFSTLEAICNYLECQPGDIIVNEKN